MENEPGKTTTRRRFALLALHSAILISCPLLLAAAGGCGPSSNARVVLYCAQDEDFAQESLAEFTKRTGLAVSPKFDTEAGKSVELFAEIQVEQDRPRCDVFWNNEILNTILLQRQGLLVPYASPAGAPYPASCHGPDDTWHAFANRARVMIVNTQLVPEKDRPRSILDLADPRWKGRVVIAKPLHGTSLTMAASLFDVLGEDGAKKFYQDLMGNGLQIAPGNKQVAEWVGQGKTPGGQQVSVGITDTDDTLEEIASGSPVAMIFPDRDAPKDSKLGTLFIPNTLCIIRGGPNLEGAKKLVDYLLSPEVETRLAETKGHQIPLNPEVKAKLPPQMETPKTVKAMQVDFEHAADLLPKVQEFVLHEFGGR
jgi:iron(III) transport system substrate-binding protein